MRCWPGMLAAQNRAISMYAMVAWLGNGCNSAVTQHNQLVLCITTCTCSSATTPILCIFT
jgi:hypothetical protein